MASIFEAIDKDNNGVINEDEFVAIVTGMVPSVSVDIAKAAFKQVQGLIYLLYLSSFISSFYFSSFLLTPLFYLSFRILFYLFALLLFPFLIITLLKIYIQESWTRQPSSTPGGIGSLALLLSPRMSSSLSLSPNTTINNNINNSTFVIVIENITFYLVHVYICHKEIQSDNNNNNNKKYIKKGGNVV